MEDWTQTLGTLPLLGIAAGAIALILVMITAPSPSSWRSAPCSGG